MKPTLIVAALLALGAGVRAPVGPCDAQSYTMTQDYSSYEPSPEEVDDSDQLIELNKIPDLCPCEDCQCANCDDDCACREPVASAPEKSVVVKRSKLFRGKLLRRIFKRR